MTACQENPESPVISDYWKKTAAALSLRHMLRFALPFGRGKLVKLLLAHGLIHSLGGTLELALFGFAAFGRKCCSSGFLLCFGFGRHYYLLGMNPRTKR